MTKLAPRLHQAWREPRLRDGTYEPRPKITTDLDWVFTHRSIVVDIANTEFRDLPVDRQNEVIAAAWAVVDFLEMKNYQVDLNDPDVRVEAGRFIHDAWATRNPQPPGSPLAPGFTELSPEEQEKDTAQVRVALEVLHDRGQARKWTSG